MAGEPKRAAISRSDTRLDSELHTGWRAWEGARRGGGNLRLRDTIDATRSHITSFRERYSRGMCYSTRRRPATARATERNFSAYSDKTRSGVFFLFAYWVFEKSKKDWKFSNKPYIHKFECENQLREREGGGCLTHVRVEYHFVTLLSTRRLKFWQTVRRKYSSHPPTTAQTRKTWEINYWPRVLHGWLPDDSRTTSCIEKSNTFERVRGSAPGD